MSDLKDTIIIVNIDNGKHEKVSLTHKLSKNLCVKELMGDDTEIVLYSQGLINVFQKIRNKCNQPITITSGYRSLSYNNKCGGAENSMHLYGRALDLYKPHYMTFNNFRQIIYDIWQGQGGIGLYENSNFIHIDNYYPRIWRG
jgi:uncharacterized protein YcbK (DUF882 family)